MPTVTEALEALRDKLPAGANFTFEVQGDMVFLDKLFIPDGGRGTGTAFLAAILAITDQAEVATRLYADPTDEPDDPDTFDLARWYNRFGFSLDHVNDDEWVGMHRDPKPWRGGAEAILADYRMAKQSFELTQDEFTRWREAATEKMYDAKGDVGRSPGM